MSIRSAAILPAIPLVLFAFGVAIAGDHPRLLLDRNHLAALRHHCGVKRLGTGGAGSDSPFGKFGAGGLDYARLKRHAAAPAGDFLPSGDLAATAFVVMTEPENPVARQCAELTATRLTQPLTVITDVFELALALDWAWELIPASARVEFIRNVRERASPLSAGDSPLDARRFREKLGWLAAAIVIDDADDPATTWRSIRARILDGAKSYFDGPFGLFLRARGPTPTSPATAAEEECLTMLALELARHVPGAKSWDSYGPDVARWMEHYLLADMQREHARGAPAMQVIRDDGVLRPLTPAPRPEKFHPITSALLAARTRDPVAALVADRVRAAMNAGETSPTVAVSAWLWSSLVFRFDDVPRADPEYTPAIRDLDGAVVLNGGPMAREVGVFDPAADVLLWIEAGQPVLRRGQHFDAGHFVLRTATDWLTAQSGDGVALEAIPSKNGAQMLGTPGEVFDIEQFECATISHNGLVIWDVAQVPKWYGANYVPRGGQRVIEGTCTDFSAPAIAARETGEILAAGACDRAAYAALDLRRAYEPRQAASYCREFLLLWGRVLVIVDRVKLGKTATDPICVFQLPVRPTVDRAELPAEKRLAGTDNAAGFWNLRDAETVAWNMGTVGVVLSPLYPKGRIVNVIGGPGASSRITEIPFAGVTYVGGGANTFERIVNPAQRERPRNVWYRLGQPTILMGATGPEGAFSAALPLHWGRVEIGPAKRANEIVFVNVMCVLSGREAPPVATAEEGGTMLRMVIEWSGLTAEMDISSGMEVGGSVRFVGANARSWRLPTERETAPDWPLRKE